jgi:pantothenate kinase
MEFYFSFIGIITAGGAYTLKHETIAEFPIKVISNEEQKPLISLVDKILSLTSSDDYLQNTTEQSKVGEYEAEIDRMVYKLYDLTPEEIAIVEGK